MACLDDIRQIAATLPGAEEALGDRFAFTVTNKGKAKGFVWAWAERIHPKKAKVPNNEVMAILVRSLTEKEIILGSDPVKYFTEPHYNGFAAVLVRLKEIPVDELRDLLIEAWKCKAPAKLVREFDET